MQRHVAFQNVLGSQVAIVEVSRAEVGTPELGRQLLLKLGQALPLQGLPVVLGVPHEGAFVADFYAQTDIRTALKEIGWIRLPWKLIELPA